MTKRTYEWKSPGLKRRALGQRKYKDDRTTSMNTCYQRAKAQVNFRNEGWDFTFEHWAAMWDEHYEERGRASDKYSMTRIDVKLPWSHTNAVVQKRADQLHNSGVTKYRIQTPKGEFRNQAQAAVAYKVGIPRIVEWRKERPDEFYYMDIKTKLDKLWARENDS